MSAQSLEPLRDYSVIVSGNLSTHSSVEGRVLVGGDFTGSNSADFATRLQNQVPSSDLTLRVGGDILNGNPINLNAGSIELGGSIDRHVNYNGGGSLISNPGVDYSPVFDDLDAASAALSGFSANSTAQVPSGQSGPLVFRTAPDDLGLAIFELDGALIFNNSFVQQLEIDNAGGASEILINVGGTSIAWNYGNLVGAFNEEYWRGNLIWNFYEAETVHFDRNIGGQILAPNATVTTNQAIDGSIYAKHLDTRGQVHLPGYQGNISLVPEPSTALLGLFGACLLLRRRRSD